MVDCESSKLHSYEVSSDKNMDSAGTEFETNEEGKRSENTSVTSVAKKYQECPCA